MKKVEGITKDLKATERFVDETSVILNKLCDWKIAQTVSQHSPRREDVLAELEKFKNIALRAEKDGIINEFFVQAQARNVIEAFKMLSDIVPELNKLQWR